MKRVAKRISTTAILWGVFGAISFPSLAGEAEQAYRVLRSGDKGAVEQLLAAGADANSRDERGNTILMRAVLYGDASLVEWLIRQGADVNATNEAGATALMRASGDTAMIRTLVSRGADVHARSALGNTPLILAARANNSADAVRLLLAEGADSHATNIFGANALMTAAASGNRDTAKLLLERGATVNSHVSQASPDAALWGGARSPLMWAAANGDTGMLKVLLKAGADVNGQEIFGTALTQAAWMDRVDAARVLLEKGADVNAVEGFSGFTALHWAASSDNPSAELTRLLLAHGARPDVEGGEQVDAFLGTPQTPLMLAEKRGETEIVKALVKAGAERREVSKKAASPLREISGVDRALLQFAIGRSAPLLEKTALDSKKAFVSHASQQNCVSCHQQYLPMMALAFARQAGSPVNEASEQALREMVREDNRNLTEMIGQATFHPEPAHAMGYALLGMAAQGERPNPDVDAMIHHLLVIQGKEGQWHNNLPRPPLQTSDVGATALAVHAIKKYGFPGRQKEISAKVERARQWLRRVSPNNTEERAYQLLGLAWAGDVSLREFVKGLQAEQREDGGWAQLPKLESDAYATGQALYALHLAGVPASAPAYRRGVRFLLQTQREDGSWFVARRAFPFQPTMRSGYAHGRDSWVSASGASWATVALSIALQAESGVLQAKASPAR